MNLEKKITNIELCLEKISKNYYDLLSMLNFIRYLSTSEGTKHTTELTKTRHNPRDSDPFTNQLPSAEKQPKEECKNCQIEPNILISC